MLDVRIEFDDNWIFSGSGTHSFAVSTLVRQLVQAYGDKIEISEQSFDQCSAKIQTDAAPDELREKLGEIIRSKVAVDDGDEKYFSISISGEDDQSEEPRGSAGQGNTSGEAESLAAAAMRMAKMAQTKSSESASSHEKKKSTEGAAEDNSESAFSKIEKLDGDTAFKALCGKIKKLAPVIHAHGTEDVFRRTCYIFSIDHGEGCTTRLELFHEFLVEEGLLDKDGSVREVSVPFAEDRKEQEDIQEMARRARNNSEGIVSFDISEWLNQTDSTNFKQFLLPLFLESPKNIVVFQLPLVSEQLIDKTMKDIDDILPVEKIVFPMRETQELHKITEGILNQYGFTMQGPAWDIFDHRIDQEKADGYYYGFHTLQKVAGQMILLEEEDIVEKNLKGKAISADAISRMSPGNTDMDQKHSGLEMLDQMTGLVPVKQTVREILSQISAAKGEGLDTSFCMHMMFTGRPGTGKTTVARLIGLILKENHILRNGYFYEVRGRDLCGRYIGETAVITKKICQQALGSVLFIDEAYSLYRGDGDTRDFGREALDTLIAEMENNRDDLVVILAGYPDEMQTMLSGNSGLRSRIPYHIDFPNYTRDELYQIFMGMIPSRLKKADDFEAAAKSFFESLPDEIYNRYDFGNARFDRNLYDRVFAESALRSTESGNSITLSGEDFEKAVAKILPAARPVEHKKYGF